MRSFHMLFNMTTVLYKEIHGRGGLVAFSFFFFCSSVLPHSLSFVRRNGSSVPMRKQQED